MPRGISGANLTEIDKKAIRSVFLFDIVIDDSTTLYLTTAPASLSFNSQTYTSSAHLLSIPSISDDLRLTNDSFTLQLSAVDQSLVSLFVSSPINTNPVTVYRGFLDDDYALVADPWIAYKGLIDGYDINESRGDATINLNISSIWSDFQRVAGRKTNSQSQQLFYPDDTGFDQAPQTLDGIPWTVKFVDPPKSTGAPNRITLSGLDIGGMVDQRISVTKQGADINLPVVYGEARLSGTVVYAAAVDGESINSVIPSHIPANADDYDVTDVSGGTTYLALVVAIAEGECELMGGGSSPEIRINKTNYETVNDNLEAIDKHKVQYMYYNGTSTQDVGEYVYGFDGELKGVAAAVFFAPYVEGVIDSIPDFDFNVRKYGYDVKTGASNVYTYNPANMVYDYLTNPIYGKGIATSDIDLQSFKDSFDFCEALIDKGDVGGNTHKRYQIGGTVDTSKKIFNNLQTMLANFNGVLQLIDGKYHLVIDKEETASLILTDDDVFSAMRVSSKGRKDMFNRVTSKFIDPNQNYAVTEVIFDSASDRDDDGGITQSTTISLDFVDDFYRARHLAEIVLRRSRRLYKVSFTTSAMAMNLMPSDVVTLTTSVTGWIDKEFKVQTVKINEDATVDLVLVEYQAGDYDGTSYGDAPTVAASSLPSPLAISAPTNIAADWSTSYAVSNGAGELYERVRVTWDAPEYDYVTAYEIYQKELRYTTYRVGSNVYTTSYYTNPTLVATVAADQNEAYFVATPNNTFGVSVKTVGSLNNRSILPNPVSVETGKTEVYFKPAKVSGLELAKAEITDDGSYDFVGGQGNDYEFGGVNVALQWRPNAVFGSFEIGGEPALYGANAGDYDAYFSEYKILIFAEGDLIREAKSTVPTFVYDWKNHNDDYFKIYGVAGGWRELTFKVAVKTQQGFVGDYTTITVTNTAPTVGVLSAYEGIDTVTLTAADPDDRDWQEVAFYVGSTSGFATSAAIRSSTSKSLTQTFGNLTPNTTYYAKYQVSDPFGSSALSDEISFTTTAETVIAPVQEVFGLTGVVTKVDAALDQVENYTAADQVITGIESDVTVTGGGITMSSGGAIKGGQTAYDTGTGFYLGYSTDAYKFSIGNASGDKLTFDGTNLAVTGNISADSGDIGGWTIGSTSLSATGIELETSGTPNLKVSSGANYVILDGGGLRGVDATLGTTVNIPTNGDAPTFSSGIINSTVFNITSSGVLETSAEAGDGSTAGVRINDTGIYAYNATSSVPTAFIDSAGVAHSFTGNITVTNNDEPDPSAKSAGELGISVTSYNTTMPNIAGESDGAGLGCQANKTYAEAVTLVEGIGARLPTLKEVLAGAVRGTGCGYDSTYVWTQTAGKTVGTRYVCYGTGDAGTGSPLYKEHSETSTANVRFVAEVVSTKTSTKKHLEDSTTISSGGITMSSGGSIKGGQTAYDTGTGFYLGYDSSAYKFSIGNASGNKLTFNGSDLAITGSIVSGSAGNRIEINKSSSNEIAGYTTIGTDVTQVFTLGLSASDLYVLDIGSALLDKIGIYAASGDYYAINGKSFGNHGIVGESESASHAGIYGTGTAVGVKGETSATSVEGVSTATSVYKSGLIGVKGQVEAAGNATTGNGVYGEITGDGADGNGVYGKIAADTSCGGKAGVYGESAKDGNYGVYGLATNVAGIYGESSSSHGVYGNGVTGVYGNGTSTGVLGKSDLRGITALTEVAGVTESTRVAGLYAEASTVDAVYGRSSTGVGVKGYASGAGAGVVGTGRYGVKCYRDNNVDSAALYIEPQAGATSGAPDKGSINVDTSGNMYINIDGTVSGWKRILTEDDL